LNKLFSKVIWYKKKFKGNLIFMSNLYHKVIVTCVCTALGFALGANKKAEAATFSIDYYWLASNLTFHAIDGGSYGSFDGLGDKVTRVSYSNDFEFYYSHSWYTTQRTDTMEVAALLEFPLSTLTKYITADRGENARITSITNAVLRIFASGRDSHGFETFFSDKYAVMGAFGYVGNGRAEASDLEAGVFLDSQNIIGPAYGSWYDSWYDFNVTPFIKEIFSNNNEFAGFALRPLSQHEIFLPAWERIPTAPRLIISGEIEGGVEPEPEPVPEPTTIFGSIIGLCVGGWLKRKNQLFRTK
jgi:hypothetical protein